MLQTHCLCSSMKVLKAWLFDVMVVCKLLAHYKYWYWVQVVG